MLKAVVCDAMKQVRRAATRRGPPCLAASQRSLSTATAHDHPEKSDESWRMCHRIVDCGTDWSQILNLTYQAPLDGSNTAITVMRLAKVSRGNEHLVAKDPRFQHLIRRIQGGTELSDLSPAQLSGIKEDLNKMGVNVDVGTKNG